MGGRQGKSNKDISKIAEDLKKAVESSNQQQEQMVKIARELRKANIHNDKLMNMLDNANETTSQVRGQYEGEKLEKQRWKKFSVALQRKYNDQQKLVQQLITKNEYLERLDKDRNLSLLQRVQLAIDTDPMFEDEIRGILGKAPTMKKDFRRVFLADVDDGYNSTSESPHKGRIGYDGPQSVEYGGSGRVESDGSCAVESDGLRAVECDSVRVESDGCGAGASYDDGYDSAAFFDIDEVQCDDDTLESSVAIAYVLSKMHYQK